MLSQPSSGISTILGLLSVPSNCSASSCHRIVFPLLYFPSSFRSQVQVPSLIVLYFISPFYM